MRDGEFPVEIVFLVSINTRIEDGKKVAEGLRDAVKQYLSPYRGEFITRTEIHWPPLNGG